MSEVLKKFGRYFLLDQVAQGGMAEIYRARLADKDGAGRLLVIKRIQAGFGGNSEFLQMFKSEIKVTMGFNHSNIVQVYDFGEEQNQPYIAMEFVDGKNLRQFLNRFNELKQPFPVELACHIIEQAGAGLHYAHAFKDKITGDSLNIVHRDISPQNILISFEGNVKVIDFGIAKATTNSEHTRAGVIKGKPSYLSPEQISGDPLDGRTDLFALGAVFWELLTGRKLFQGENDLAVLRAIESCSTSVRAPSEINPNVPKEVDAIVLKLLSRDPTKRYQTGDELSRALRRFVSAYAPDFGTSDVSQIAKELFNQAIVEDRKKIQRLNDRIEQLLQNEVPEISELKTDPSKDGIPSRREETTTYVSPPQAVVAPLEIKMDETVRSQRMTIETERPARTRHTMTPGRGTQTSSKSLGYSGGVLSRPIPEEGGIGWIGWVAAAGIIGAVSYFGPHYGLQVPYLSKMMGARVRPAAVASAEDPSTKQTNFDSSNPGAPKRNAILKLRIFPSGGDGTISVNGKVVDPSDPTIEVPTDAPLELSVQRPNFQDFRSEFSIDARLLAENGEFVRDISLEPVAADREPAAKVDAENAGQLTILSTPSAEATIYVNGKLWKKGIFTPIEKLPAPAGRFEVRLKNSVLDLEDQQTFTLDQRQAKQIQSTLRPKGR